MMTMMIKIMIMRNHIFLFFLFTEIASHTSHQDTGERGELTPLASPCAQRLVA